MTSIIFTYKKKWEFLFNKRSGLLIGWQAMAGCDTVTPSCYILRLAKQCEALIYKGGVINWKCILMQSEH